MKAFDACNYCFRQWGIGEELRAIPIYITNHMRKGDDYTIFIGMTEPLYGMIFFLRGYHNDYSKTVALVQDPDICAQSSILEEYEENFRVRIPEGIPEEIFFEGMWLIASKFLEELDEASIHRLDETREAFSRLLQR